MTMVSSQDPVGPAAPAPFARILVGSIPTAEGDDARALGLQFARLCDARLQLVSVVEARLPDDPGEQPGPPAIHDDARGRASTGLEQAAGQLAEVVGASRVEQHLEISSSAARGLHDAAVAGGADLIVVGSSHRGPVGRLLLGSVGERLLSRAPCAVALAPRGHASATPRPLGQVLVAFDGSPEGRLGLRAAHALAKRAGATVVVVTAVVPSSPGVAVSDAPPLSGRDVVVPAGGAARHETIRLTEAFKRQERTARETLEAATAELGDPAVERRVLVGPDPATMILNLAGDQTGLLVLGSRSYGQLRRALVGSVSIHLIRHARCPLLIIPRGSNFDGTRS